MNYDRATNTFSGLIGVMFMAWGGRDLLTGSVSLSAGLAFVGGAIMLCMSAWAIHSSRYPDFGRLSFYGMLVGSVLLLSGFVLSIA